MCFLIFVGQVFCAHKVVLAACSTYFERVFTRGHSHRDKEQILHLQNVSSIGLQVNITSKT